MQLNSFSYLIFLVVAVVLYWALPQRFRRLFVLAASLAFYATWGPVFLVVPLSFAGVVFVVGRRMSAEPLKTKQWMWIGVSCALALLIFFKYHNFLVANVNVLITWLGARQISFVKQIPLPVGISFYTFEAIGYLVDVRQGRAKPATFLELCLFLLFWPNVISGPIVRAREILPQLQFRERFEPRFVFEGTDRILWGLVQKNVVANFLGIWVDKGFHAGGGSPSTLDAWFLAVAFGLQIYFDFAGYSNMAIGAARLLGITLPDNFRQPYHAVSPADFWARWHMTLSRWIRDYLFFPIGVRYKAAPVHLYLSLVGVMALVGLWHGAGWSFVLWGVMHGTYLVLYRLYDQVRASRPALNELQLVSRAWRPLTLIGVTAAWVPFRAPNMQKAAAILSSMFVRIQRGAAYSTVFYVMTLAVVLLCAVEPLLLAKLSELDRRADENTLSMFRVIGRPLVYCVALVLFTVFDQQNAQFIYFQF
jgi:alginate O-acetyltransferase complex protein AlgI